MRSVFFTLFVFISFSIHAQWIEKDIRVSGQLVTNLKSMYFVNDSTGWVVGNATSTSKILKTTDGGNTWAYQNVGSFGDLDNVYFVNENIGFATGDILPFLKTTDGGITWTSVPIIPGSDFRPSYLSKFYFISDLIGFYTTSNAIYKTTDSGATWTQVLQNPVNPISNIDFSSVVSNGIAVCFAGSVYKTTDTGNTWQLVPSFTSSYLYGVSHTSSDIIVGGEQGLFKSSNSGVSWSSISLSQSTPPNGFISVTFASDSIGFCGGSPYEIFKTTDGGNTWNFQTSFQDIYNPNIQMVNDTLGYILADPNTGKFYKTTNGGETVTTSVSNFDSKNTDILVYPTFCNDVLTVVCDNSNVGSDYKIINQNGVSVLEGKLDLNNNTINTDKLSSGNYVFVIYGKQVQSTKIFKTK
jgi:photosystem II stability/assembly factor-like uncharacterized protein